jgi:hypothetical protein
MDPALRKMVRIAYHSTDPKVRRGFATYVSKIAHYSGDFTQWVKGQKFRHPETGKQVSFWTLPYSKGLPGRGKSHAQELQEIEDIKSGEITDTEQLTSQSAVHTFWAVNHPHPGKPSKLRKELFKDRKQLRGKPRPGREYNNIRWTPGARAACLNNLDPREHDAAKESLSKPINRQQLRDAYNKTSYAITNKNSRQAEQLRGAGYTADDIKKMNGEFMNMFHNPHTFHQNVTAVANEYDLDAEDAEQLYDFRADKPAYGRKLSPEQLFHKFLSRAKPETRERMQGMNIQDFMVMYLSIMADEDDEAIDLSRAVAAGKGGDHTDIMQGAMGRGKVGSLKNAPVFGKVATIFAMDDEGMPEQPFSSVQDARDDGVLAAQEYQALKDELIAANSAPRGWSLMIPFTLKEEKEWKEKHFPDEDGDSEKKGSKKKKKSKKKKASLTSRDRKIIRLAYNSKSQEVRRKCLSLLSK